MSKSHFDNFQDQLRNLQEQVQELFQCDKDLKQSRISSLESSFLSLCEETSKSQHQLAAYERRKLNLSLNELQEGIQRIKDSLKPQYKLRWDVAGKEKVSPEAQKASEVKVSPQHIETVSDKSAVFVVENLKDETRNVTDSLVVEDMRRSDVRFLNCENCCLYLNSWTRNCQLKGLRNCKVMLGPVETAVYIQECTDCDIYVAAQQVRIHDCHSCTFRVQSKQGSILERSKDIVFGPYIYEYPGIEDDFEKVHLYCEKDSWKKVRDFQFLSNFRERKHWRLLEQDEEKCASLNAK